MKRGAWVLLVWPLVWLLALPALADALPLSQSVRVGRPPQPVLLQVEAMEGAARVRVGESATEVPVVAASATVEVLELAGGSAIAVVRIGEGDARAAALVGPRGVIWAQRLGLRGDPGERYESVLETRDRTGDGKPDIVVGFLSEGVRLCGAPPSTLLLPRAIDPASLELRPVVLRRVPERGAARATLAAQAATPGPTGAPLVRALQITGASSTAGAPEGGGSFAAPRALASESGGLWLEGWGGLGTGEFVSAQWSSTRPIAAFAFTVSPADRALAARLGRPRELWIETDSGPYRVTWSGDPLQHPGARYWVRFAEPIRTRCLAFMIGDVQAPSGTPAAQIRTGLSRIEAYTDLDFGGGAESLAAELAGSGPVNDETIRLLTQLGEPGVAAVASRWNGLGPDARRRAAQIMSANYGAASAVEWARAHAGDGEAGVAEAAALILARDGDIERLAALARQGRVPALEALGRIEEVSTFDTLAPMATEEAAASTTAWHEALRASATRLTPEELEQSLARWLATSPSLAARIRVIEAIHAAPAGAEPSLRILREALPQAESFEDKYGIVRVAASLPRDAAVDAWLEQLARRAPEWMMRDAALQALVRRQNGAERLARALLSDTNPRVRVTALEAVGGRDPAALERLAQQDPWPFVRRAALRAHSTATNIPADRRRALARHVIDDNSMNNRAEAIAFLTAERDRGAWPAIAARLADANEWPVVTEAAIVYVGTLCLADSSDALMNVFRRGMRPDAWGPDVDVAAQALTTLVRLGGQAGRDALQMASRGSTREELRALAPRLTSQLGRCASNH